MKEEIKREISNTIYQNLSVSTKAMARKFMFTFKKF